MPEKPTVAICTDDPIWGAGIQVLFGRTRDESPAVVITAHPAEWVLQLRACDTLKVIVLEWTPDILLDVVRNVLQSFPQVPLVLWSRSIPVEFAYQAAQSGVRGVLRRPCTIEDLRHCVDAVAEGGTWFDNALLSAFLGSRSVALTRREAQLVTLLAHGLKNKEIAAELAVSEGTVKVYMSKLFQKLGVKDRFELALYGLKNVMPERPYGDVQPARMLLPGLKPAQFG